MPASKRSQLGIGDKLANLFDNVALGTFWSEVMHVGWDLRSMRRHVSAEHASHEEHGSPSHTMAFATRTPLPFYSNPLVP